MKRILFPLFLIVAVTLGCSSDNNGPNPDDFDRQAILVNWADNIIVPAFANMSNAARDLEDAAISFDSNPSLSGLQDLRGAWEDAYLAFQHVSMFEMGKAMELRYRDNLNVYPTDTTEIKNNISQGGYNLELPSLVNSQGFPALDFLLNGLADTDQEILSFYTTLQDAGKYRTYVVDLTQRISGLTDEVLAQWTGDYRDTFVNNDGNGANASLDMMVNDYIFYYEKHLRAGKVGIPAGVFSGTPLPSHVEAYYSEGFSKELLIEAIEASKDFFNGSHFVSGNSGESLNSYLDFLNTMKNSIDLSALVNLQFDSALELAKTLSPDFSNQVEKNNTLMLQTYDELQKNVVLLKVDMLQALNIGVDYVDADGD